MLTGCGEPSEAELAQKRMQLEHEAKMAEIKAQLEIAKIQSGNYTIEQAQAEYEQQGQQAYTQTYQNQMQQAYQQDSSGDLAVGLLGGAVMGYMASELLDNGWSSGYDSYGRTTYYDNNHRPVSMEKYNVQRSSHKVSRSIPKKDLSSKLKRFKRKASVLAEKAKRNAFIAKDKALAKAKPAFEKAKLKAKQSYNKAKPVIVKAKDKAKTKAAPLIKKSKTKIKSSFKSFKKRR